MVYSATMSESQRVIWWQIIFEKFGTNIRHIYGFDNMVTDTLSLSPYTPVDKYNTSTVKAQC